MDKSAEIVTRLQPHQERAVRKALLRNIILAHSTGSGKTLSAIAATDAIGRPATVLTPAPLVDNFKKEIARHKRGGPPMEVLSLPWAARHRKILPKGNTLIIDEAHALRNADGARARYVSSLVPRAGRVIALTGTPVYNRPADIAGLVNLVSGERVFPRRPEDFERIYVRDVTGGSLPDRIRRAAQGGRYGLMNREELGRKLRDHVDVFDTDVEKPARTDETARVGMDGRQRDIYRYLMRRVPGPLRRLLRGNLPPGKAQARQLNAFLGGIRQVSNTAEGFAVGAGPGQKVREAAGLLARAMGDSPRMRALVYSNYLDSGVESYARVLDSMGIPYGKYTGSQSRGERLKLVEDYNSGKVPVMLVSGSGSEGLDLRGTRLIQLLEPHWNDSRLEQVVGRGIRYGSHSDLPPSERSVRVQHFIAGLPGSWRTSVDEYLSSRAAEKAGLAGAIRDLMRDRG